MPDLTLTDSPVVRAQMLIRKPANEVYDAFVDPAHTTHFWFTKSTGRLDAHPQVTWTWEMYGVSAQVNVKILEPDRRIVVDWGTTVEWLFEPYGPDATLVKITNSGFLGDGDALVAQALDAMGGFTSLLAGAKAYLEHGLALNLVADHHPPART